MKVSTETMLFIFKWFSDASLIFKKEYVFKNMKITESGCLKSTFRQLGFNFFF